MGSEVQWLVIIGFYESDILYWQVLGFDYDSFTHLVLLSPLLRVGLDLLCLGDIYVIIRPLLHIFLQFLADIYGGITELPPPLS